MFKWIIHLFYRKKVRRIETMSKALQLIGKGELHVAGQLIQEVRPTEFLDDLALYYFVRGRYHLQPKCIFTQHFFWVSGDQLFFWRLVWPKHVYVDSVMPMNY